MTREQMHEATRPMTDEEGDAFLEFQALSDNRVFEHGSIGFDESRIPEYPPFFIPFGAERSRGAELAG